MATTAVRYITNGEGDDGPGCGDIEEEEEDRGGRPSRVVLSLLLSLG